MGRQYLNEEQKNEILRLYHEGYMSIEIAEKIHFCSSTISRFLKKNGLPIQNQRHCSTREKEAIVAAYSGGKTIKEVQKMFPQYTESWINIQLRKAGVTRSRGTQPKLNSRYFAQIDSEKKAYFLGLLYADGHIDHTVSKRNFTISIGLNEEDGYLIEQFAEEIQTNLKVKHYQHLGENGKMRHTACLSLHSRQMYYDLLAQGMTEQKVQNLNHLPKLSDDLMKPFLRGYFDGDGSVFESVSKLTGKKSIGVNFCGTYGFLEELNIFLNKYIISKDKKRVRHPFDRGNYASLHFAGSSMCRQLFNLLYDKPCSIYMQRKYQKFISFFSEEEQKK